MRVGILHTAFIGDVVLLGLLVEALAREGHDVFVIAKPICAQLYENDARVKDVLKIKKEKGLNKIKSVFSSVGKIQELNLDVLLCAHLSLTSALITKLTGIKKTVGFDKSAASFLFHTKVHWSKEAQESVRMLELAPHWLVRESIAKELKDFGQPILRSEQKLQKFNSQFPGFLESREPFFVVSPGSVWATKKYPHQLLAEVVVKILDNHPAWRCVINGGPDEELDIQMFCEAVAKQSPQFIPSLFDASKVVSVGEMASLLRRARFTIANDSGPLHVANGVGTPTVAIFGPTPVDTGMAPKSSAIKVLQYNSLHPKNPLLCQPCSPHGGKVCPEGHHLCMNNLLPSEVVAAVDEILQKEIRG